MKIKVLMDNISNDSFFKKEWGLSILIKHNRKNYLLDFGKTGNFTSNAYRLDLDLTKVDKAVLSHAHYDHANGMNKFFKINNIAKLYMKKEARDLTYINAKLFNCLKVKKYIGIKKDYYKKFADRFEFIDKVTELDKEVFLVPHKTNTNDSFSTKNMFVRKYNEKDNTYSKEFIPDEFNHELSLVIDMPEGLVIFNSCSHKGVKQIISEVKKEFDNKKVYAYVGGLHLFNKKDSDIEEVGKYLKKEDIEYVLTGHCTGERAFNKLFTILGEKVQLIESGFEIEI